MRPQANAATHWISHAHNWDNFGPPLRPQESDVALVRQLLTRAEPECRILMLGVTPEYARTAWPEGTLLTAVDRSAEMIRFVWPATAVPERFNVVQGDWSAMPIRSHSQSAVIGDGVTTVLPRWSAVSSVLREVHRVLHEDGTALFRLFIKPVHAEEPGELLEHVLRGSRLGFHSFKLRLLMALQPSLALGVAPRDAYKWWQDFELAYPECITRQGWPAEQRHTIAAYRGSPDRYWFPTEAEMRREFEKYFTVEDVVYSSYECADRCPLFVVRRKN